MLPVSNFAFCDASKVPDKFLNQATIYVLGAEKGKFITNEFLVPNGVGLPDGWEHGYTKGIAIQGRTVAYWLEIW